MKIALTGSAGTGKSTLCRTLAKALNIIAIDENYQPLDDAKIKGDFPPRIMQILANKKTLEKQAGDFVVDRCPLDLLHMWLNQSGHLVNPALTEQFFMQCREQINGYDFVILTPWNSIPLLQNNNAVPRNMNIMEQLRNHASMVGHAFMWVPKKRIIEIPQALTDNHHRVDFILDTIQKRRPELLQST